MKYVFAAALLLVSAPVAAAPIKAASVDAVEGDWSHLPPLFEERRALSVADAADKIHKNALEAKCNLEGLTRRQLDLSLPYAAQFESDGSLKRIIFKRLNCPQVEGVVASLLLKLAEANEIKPQGRVREGWFQGHLSFLSIAKR